jgi:hypothetical protein
MFLSQGTSPPGPGRKKRMFSLTSHTCQEHPRFEKDRKSAKIRTPQRARDSFPNGYIFESNESKEIFDS